MSESREAQAARRKTRTQQEADDYAKLMSEPWGRRIVADIIGSVQLEDTLFNGNSRDAFNEGRRDLARTILQRAKSASFDNYLLMQREKHEERTNAG